jgi:MFS family permease
VSGVVANATAGGPLLGAVLTENAGWRSIFFINVPLGIALLITAVVTLPASRASSGERAWILPVWLPPRSRCQPASSE